MLHEITAAAGARKRRKRVGRGESSGMGKTCGRGSKGAQSRSGYRGRILFEGGAVPLFRHLPKRGFSNFNFRTDYDAVNLAVLEAHFPSGATVTPMALRDKGLVPGGRPVKVLGDGSLTKKLTVEANAFSASARAALDKAGGAARLIERRDPAERAKAKRNAAKRAPDAAGSSRIDKKKTSRGPAS
jgi:large subunit ribosomal protein L15